MIHRLLLWSAASALLLPLSLVGIAYASAADASIAYVASPAVSGPVTGGNGVPVLFGHTAFDLASVGYAQSEFFVAGTADEVMKRIPGSSGRSTRTRESSSASSIK